MFLPKYKLIEEKPVRCLAEKPTSAANCRPELPPKLRGAPAEVFTALEKLPAIQPIRTKISEGCSASSASTSTTILEKHGLSSCTDCKVEFVSDDRCAHRTDLVERREKSCPDNLGVSGDPNEESYEEAQEACPLSEDAHHHRIRWTERTMSDLPVREFTYTRATCLAPAEPTRELLPAPLRLYRKPIHWQQRTPLDPLPHYTKDLSPKEYRRINSEYDCPALSTINETFTIEGRHQLTCDWKDTVQAQAHEQGLIQHAHFTPYRRRIDWVEADQPPSEPCYSMRPTYSSMNGEAPSEILIPGSPFTRDNFPMECINGSWNCRTQLAGFEGGTGNTNSDEITAEEAGRKAVKALLPNPNRISLDLERTDTQATAEAATRIPLSLLGGRAITVSHRNHRKLEGAR